MSCNVSPGSTVTLHLSLTLEDGTVAESTLGGEPLTFTMGTGTLASGLELALYGLYPGETQRIELTPEQAFGRRDPAKVHRMPRAAFGPDLVLEPGAVIGFETPEGEEIGGAVLSLDADSVEVDFNHPLAGHVITFDVEVLDVVTPAGTLEE
jgi:FKBP-type peptidyl-prolyl cis-trans isomerase SlpA